MKIGVVVPCYRVRDRVGAVIRALDPSVDVIYVVDDGCPEGTDAHVEATIHDPRVRVLRNAKNLGVGGAVLRGYRQALDDGVDVVVKVDGDGQMDPALMPRLLRPILSGEADYAKGNRFATYAQILGRSRRDMPRMRWFGNNMLSFGHKVVSGYWQIVDPTNGYTAIHRQALRGIDFDDVAQDYFFETDMLCELNLINAVVTDVPMPSICAGEPSRLDVYTVARTFPPRMVRRFVRRILYKYFLIDFNVASLELLFGLLLLGWGVGFGAVRWIAGVAENQVNSAGTVMLAGLPIILGFQLLLAALSYDIANTPRTPLSRSADA